MSSRPRLSLVGALAALLVVAPPARAIDGDSSGLAVSARAFEGLPRCVLIEGSIAYVGLDSGLGVIDISDPSAPTLLAHVPLSLGLLHQGGGALVLAVAVWHLHAAMKAGYQPSNTR